MFPIHGTFTSVTTIFSIRGAQKSYRISFLRMTRVLLRVQCATSHMPRSPLASRLELVSVLECNQDDFRRLRSGVKSLHERQISNCGDRRCCWLSELLHRIDQ